MTLRRSNEEQRSEGMTTGVWGGGAGGAAETEERKRERYSGITAFPPGVFGLHDFICEAIINFLNEISN